MEPPKMDVWKITLPLGPMLNLPLGPMMCIPSVLHLSVSSQVGWLVEWEVASIEPLILQYHEGKRAYLNEPTTRMSLEFGNWLLDR